MTHGIAKGQVYMSTLEKKSFIIKILAVFNDMRGKPYVIFQRLSLQRGLFVYENKIPPKMVTTCYIKCRFVRCYTRFYLDPARIGEAGMPIVKKFSIESHSVSGAIIARKEIEIDDNPAYGEEACKLILANNPDAFTVSIVEQLCDEKGAPLIMKKQNPENPDRVQCIERMRFTRKMGTTEFYKSYEDWTTK